MTADVNGSDRESPDMMEVPALSHGVNARQLDRLHEAPFTETCWYAPGVKTVIKSDYALYLNHRAVLTRTSELSAFSLAR